MKGNCGVSVVIGGRRWRAQEGYVAILFAVVLIILLAFIGMAVDVGQAYDTKTHYRIVADAGSLAGAKALAEDSTPESIWAEVQRLISLNGLPPSEFSFDCGFWSGSTYISKTNCDVDEGVNAVRVTGSTLVRTMYARLVGNESFSPGVLSVSSAPSYNCMNPFGIEGSYLDPPSNHPIGSTFKIDADMGNWGKILINNGKEWQMNMLQQACSQDIGVNETIDNISGHNQVRQTFDALYAQNGTTEPMVFPVVTDFPSGRSGQVTVLHFIEVQFAEAPTGTGSNFEITFRVVTNPVNPPQKIQLGEAILVE